MSGRFSVRRADDVRESLSPEWLEFIDDTDHLVHPKVVLEADLPVATGSLADNTLHPEPMYFRFRIDEEADSECLTHLLDALQADLDTAGHHPIHFSAPQSNEIVARWAEATGFRPIMQTWLGALRSTGSRFIDGHQFRRLSDGDTPVLRRTLAVLHAQIYRAQHQWNPPLEIDPEMAERLFLNESELIPEHLWYSVDELDRPSGVVSLRSTSAPEVVEFGWFGVLDGVDDSVHRALFETALGAVGDRILDLEIDANQQHTLNYLNSLSVTWQQVIVRYERRAAE